jgi:hypothetical protein
MNFTQTLLLVCFYFLFNCGTLISQEFERYCIVNSYGSLESLGNIKVDWNIGQLAVTTLANENLNLTQGFFQPIKLNPINSVSEFLIPHNLSVFPNPSDSWFKIKGIAEYDVIKAVLVSNQGLIVIEKNNNISGDWDVEDLVSGTYFLLLFTNNSYFRPIKFIKN